MIKPLRYTEYFVFYYKVFVYFAGLIFSLVIFFPNMDMFSDTTIFICYMKYGLIYDVFINGFIFLVVILNLYVMVRFTRKSLYYSFDNANVITRIIITHRLYVLLWTFFQLSNFIFMFVDNLSIRIVHGIMMAVSPLVISVVFIFSILINKGKSTLHLELDEKNGLLITTFENIDESEENSEENQNSEVEEKDRHLIDTLLILNPRDNGDAKNYVNRNENIFKESPNQHRWEVTDNFKEVMRREVVQYIVKAFDVCFEIHRRENNDENIVRATMIDVNVQEGTPEVVKPKKKG